MFTVQFRILEGDFENSCLFMNQLITEGWQIGQVNKFLRSLDVNDTVEFKTYTIYVLENMLLLSEKQKKENFNI